MEATRSLRPLDANRVASRIAPKRPTPIRRFVGNSMMPSVLESTKNNTNLFQIDVAPNLIFCVIRGLDPRIHPSSQEHHSKMMDCPGSADKFTSSALRGPRKAEYCARNNQAAETRLPWRILPGIQPPTPSIRTAA